MHRIAVPARVATVALAVAVVLVGLVAPAAATTASEPESESESESESVSGGGVTIDLRNDADRDGVASDDEVAVEPEADVGFTAVVTNVSDVAGTIGLSVTVEGVVDSRTSTLVGPDPDVSTTCVVDGQPFTAEDALQPGAVATCTFTMTRHAPPPGERLDSTATVTLQPSDADPLRASDATTVRSPDVDQAPRVAALAVEVAADADGDGVFTDAEFADGPGQDVDVEAVITNTGERGGQVRLFDTSGEAPPTFLHGLDPEASASGEVACTDEVDEPVDASTVLAPGAALRCMFTLPAHSPPAATDVVVDVTAELVWYGRDGDVVTQVDVLATAADTTSVTSREVLGVVVENDEPDGASDEEPAADELPAAGGADALSTGLLAMALLGLGGLLLHPARRSRALRVRSTENR